MSKNGSIKYQVTQRINRIFRPGVSRHSLQKELGISGSTYSPYIHSYSYRDTSIRQGAAFMMWAKEAHGCRTLEQAEKHVNGYIAHMRESSFSPWTQKTAVSSICKLYGTRSTDYDKTEARNRANITRSRGEKANDRNFNENNHREFVDFARTLGLRRSEYRNLVKDEVRTDKQGCEFLANHLTQRNDGRYVLENVVGKGGKYRDILLAGAHVQEAVERIEHTREGEKIWPTVPRHADIHGYRHDYAQALYREVARDPTTLPRAERYECKGDMAGVWLDRDALRAVSLSTGHVRVSISVIYVRG